MIQLIPGKSADEAEAPRPRIGLFFRYRRVLVVLVHQTLWMASFFGAFALRFDFHPSRVMSHLAWEWLFALLTVRSLTSAYFGAFHGLWRYTGARDLQTLLKATTLASLLYAATLELLGFQGFPRSIFIIDWLGTIILVGGLRFGTRTLREFTTHVASMGQERRLLIVGAGNSGEMLLREIQKSQGNRYLPIGFVDDNPTKHMDRIHNVRILGAVHDVPRLVAEYEVQEIIIAIPTAHGRDMRRIVALCKPAGVPIRTLPGIDQLINGQVNITQVRDVAIDDLLGRAPVDLQSVAVSQFIRGKRVMITGAGGSIGSELCRQVCRFAPERLMLVEQAENALFYLEVELQRMFPDVPRDGFIGDVFDRPRMRQIFGEAAPHIVLHAAAHKHVPLMERNPTEAIKNNILATRDLADLAESHRVQNFVIISSDKAVNPSSVMGASKRAAEMYIQAISQRSKTRFNIVRFGNVLGSAGSVIPTFQDQIKRGGPVTVTHPDMKRYFMTIPEACQLVLQAGAMGQGGELFLLDMGEPVKIVDLARDLISLSGLEPDEDIEIRFTGIRPGEKLSEELHITHEHVDKTLHPKIFRSRCQPPVLADLNREFDNLAVLVQVEQDPTRLKTALALVVPEYKEPKHPLLTEARVAVESVALHGAS